MTEDARAMADRIARTVHLVRSSPYIPYEPTDLQWAALCSDKEETLFAGGLGGGKSFYMLMSALMYVHVPGYAAMIFRRTYPDLMQAGGLIPLAAEWLSNTDARKHDGGKRWSFPSGATLTFEHMENPQERFRKAGSEIQFLGWDEVAQMEFECYDFLRSRMRRSTTMNPELANVPMRIVSTANPGHKYAQWVKEYFISDAQGNRVSHPKRLFIPSTLDDNPHLDREEYAARLEALDPVMRAQMRHGDWNIMPIGNMFKEENFMIVPGRLTGDVERVRSWDLAGSDKKKSDYCAGILTARSRTTGEYRFEHVVHAKFEPGPLETAMRQTAELDGHRVRIVIEEERSGAGKLVIANMRRVLKGYTVVPTRPVGDKVARAGLFSALVDRGEVTLTQGAWNKAFIDECVGFPGGAHDDQVDAASQACHYLARWPLRDANSSPGSSSALTDDGIQSDTNSSPGSPQGPATKGGEGPRNRTFYLPGPPPSLDRVRRTPFGDNAIRDRTAERGPWRGRP